jgi:hypothetical protein
MQAARAGRGACSAESVRKFSKRLKIYSVTGTAGVVAGFFPISFI